MAEYYWKLEKYTGQNSRFRCPKCNKPRQYTRFINAKGEYAPFEYGRCNRVDKCGYFKVPTKIKTDAPVFIPKKEVQQFVDWEEYKHHLGTKDSSSEDDVEPISDFLSPFCGQRIERPGPSLMKELT